MQPPLCVRHIPIAIDQTRIQYHQSSQINPRELEKETRWELAHINGSFSIDIIQFSKGHFIFFLDGVTFTQIIL